MSEVATVDQLLRRAHFFLTEGQEEEALTTLKKVQAENLEQEREVAYLYACCSTSRGRWDEAAQFLLSADITAENIDTIKSSSQTERRRRAYYLLLLGNIAINLGRYEEALSHYTQCIKFLDERRMNDVSVRIKARCGQGTASTQTGFYTVALTHYEDALRLCGEDTRHPNLPDIYYGFCDTYRHMGNNDRAFDYGKKALQLYVDRSDKKLEGRMRSLLGRICYQMRDFHNASYHYTEALALAISVNNPVLIMLNLTDLAEVRLAEGLLDEARRYCERALEYQERVQKGHFLGMMYIVHGKVAEAEAGKAEGQQARDLVNEAISWYKKAEAVLSPLQARVELSAVYGRLAQILETSGQQDLAIAYWKSAYSVNSRQD